jgi:Na+/H+ antiporter NhaB
MKVDTRHLGTEVAARVDDALRLHVAEGGLIGIGVVKVRTALEGILNVL